MTLFVVQNGAVVPGESDAAAFEVDSPAIQGDINTERGCIVMGTQGRLLVRPETHHKHHVRIQRLQRILLLV